MSPRRLLLHGMAVAAATALLQACGSKPAPIIIPPPPPPPPPPPKTMLEVELVGQSAMNPDVHGRASPALVRFYELKAPAAFLAADFFSLFEKDTQVLASDATARDEHMLRPVERASLKREAQPGTRHVGVLVAYRDLEHSVWRAVVPIVRDKSQRLQIDVGPRKVSITSWILEP